MRQLFLRSGRNRPDLAPAFASFEASTGIRVVPEKVYHRDVGERCVQEAGRPTADVLVTNSRIAVEAVRARGVFEPAGAAADVVPADLRAPDRTWLAFTAWPRTAMVNTAACPDPATWPRRLDDLTTPAWRGRAACAALVEMTTVAQFASLVVARGAAWAEDLVARLVANGLRVFPSNLATREALVREGLAAALANASNVHVFRGEGHAVADAWLDQGPGEVGTSVEAHVVAVLAGTPRAAEARAFVDHLLSPSVQTDLARRYGETPVHPDVRVDGVRPLASIRATDAPLRDVMTVLPATEAMLHRHGFDVRA